MGQPRRRGSTSVITPSQGRKCLSSARGRRWEPSRLPPLSPMAARFHMTKRSPKPVRGWTRVPDYSLVDTGATVRFAAARVATSGRPPPVVDLEQTLARGSDNLKCHEHESGGLARCGGL